MRLIFDIFLYSTVMIVLGIIIFGVGLYLGVYLDQTFMSPPPPSDSTLIGIFT